MRCMTRARKAYSSRFINAQKCWMRAVGSNSDARDRYLMGLFVTRLSRYSFSYDNYGANPSATPGTSIVPGASNAEGTFTEIASAANLSADIHAIFLRIGSGFTSGQQKDHLL